MSILKKITMFVMVLAMVNFNLLVANASGLENGNSQDDKIQKANDFAMELENLSEGDQDLIIHKIQELVNTNEIELKSNEGIDYDNISIGKNPENEDIIINASLKNEEYNIEYITIVLSENELISYQENHFVANVENSTVDSIVWENGELSFSDNIQLSEEDFQNNNDGIVTFGFWSKFNDCLASMGVASWAITAASIACAGLGPGAIPCYYGLSFLTGGIIGHCFDKATR